MSAGTAAPQAVGTTKLVIKFPSNFVRAKAAASSKGKHAQYVNPTSSNYLDVYVNQVLVIANGLNWNTAQISNSNSDGTQTLDIPLYSSSNNDILVTERDTDATQHGGNLLAIGQTTFYGFSAGSSTNFPQVSMSMNATQIGYSTDGVSATLLNNGDSINFSCGNNATQNLFYMLPLDPEGAGQFSQVAGSGGIPALTVQAYPAFASPPPSNLIQNALGQYSASFDANDDSVNGNVFTTNDNPAYDEYNYNLPGADKTLIGGYAYSIPSGLDINFSLTCS